MCLLFLLWTNTHIAFQFLLPWWVPHVGTLCISSSLNTLPLHFTSSLFPSFPPSGSVFHPTRFTPLVFSRCKTMFFHEEAEAVQSSYFPVLETLFTPSKIQELFSLINEPPSPESGSYGSNRAVRSTHERKLRRMQSNRESARRSRWRKKRHLESLTNQANRFRLENRELKNRLCLTMHQNLLLSAENERLRSESVTLMARLSNLYQILGTMISR
ncbi:unnamed protein product [Sphenostylis stenocarpa]|uniref:BZIP domain-containing protein n=1 Tax=Sphenostylis stenocarpa TaxID=92480 RepID=A0AA86VSR6_9FABA|nr:unnamed protein product [Sphenostylis stenocarpa]